MSYEYLDHAADIGIRVTADSLHALFAEGAQALFQLMYDPSLVKPAHTETFSCEANAVDSLFIEFLNEIVSLIGRKDSLYTACRVLEFTAEDAPGLPGASGAVPARGFMPRAGGGPKGRPLTEAPRARVHAELLGEPINHTRHAVRTEVKAATYSGLRFSREGKQYTIQCILDV